MNKRLTITIGIPALNEEKNITNLLSQIFEQKLKSGYLTEVIVASDGSSDGTADLVNKYRMSQQKVKVNLINGKERRGKAFRENQIIDKTKTDVLVLFDADISIRDKFLVEKLINPISLGSADFTSAALKALSPKVFFEKMLEVSMQLKSVLFEVFKEGNNVFNCHGPARAFNRRAYKLLNFTETDGEDMYSYLRCAGAGLKFKFVKEASIEYRLPSNLKDHLRQSTRFFLSEKVYEEYFNSGYAKNEFHIPFSVYLMASIRALPIILKNFVYVFVYVIVFFYTKIRISFGGNYRETWKVSSSKSL